MIVCLRIDFYSCWLAENGSRITGRDYVILIDEKLVHLLSTGGRSLRGWRVCEIIPDIFIHFIDVQQVGVGHPHIMLRSLVLA